MSAHDASRAALVEFADGAGLELAEAPELPAVGGLLGRDGLQQHGAAAGQLPGGERGTLCMLTYTYRDDDQTRTVKRTAAVIALPESIGFAPYLSSRNPPGGTGGHRVRASDLAGGTVMADQDIDERWLAELLSPALTEWLGRSPDGFAWELCDGVLCASLDGHVTDQHRLASLCEDASHLAQEIREECLEEVDAGQAARSAAKPPKVDGTARLVGSILDRTSFDQPPANVVEARPRFRELAIRHPSTYFVALLMTLGWMLAVNVIGGGIFGLLLNLPNPGRAVLIFELGLFAIIGSLCLRSQINGISARLAEEGFWREYARARSLRFEDPSSFAATHAKAGLPGRPVRVMTGAFDGQAGSMLLTGDGSKRGDSIALVAGPDGPTASAELDLAAPGPSASALDAYAKRLVAQLRER